MKENIFTMNKTIEELYKSIDETNEKDLDSAIQEFLTLSEDWIHGNGSNAAISHFNKHILQNGKKWLEYPDPDPDGTVRVKMPQMTIDEYIKRAEDLANVKGNLLGDSNDRYKPYIGGVSEREINIDGEVQTSRTYVKIKRNSDLFIPPEQSFDGKPHSLRNMAEVVVYSSKRLPNGKPQIITYYLARSVGKAISVVNLVDNLPESETKVNEGSLYYICLINYTDGGVKESERFTSYKEANDYFASHKECSALIKVEGDNRKVMSEKNMKKVVPLEENLYHWHRLEKNYLTEANRQQLLQKSRNAQHYKDISKGKNRYERRMKSRISATVRDYNNIQMDPLFKRDILEIKIPVMGETDVYEVDVRVDGLLSEIQKQIHSNKGILEFKVILQSLMKVLNVGDVYIGCNCPDAKYRHAYNQTKNGYKAGYRETRPSNITNPGDTLGAGCKHVMLILANLDWCVKVSSVINNYIKYCQENLEQAYADYIFPKIYGIKYDKAVQMNLFYNGMLPDDKKTMDEITQRSLQGRDSQGKFKKNNPFAFQKKDIEEPKEDDGQLTLNLEEPVQKELKLDIEEPEENTGTEGNI